MIVLVTGCRGTGKTSLCKKLLEELQSSVPSVPTWYSIGEDGNFADDQVDETLSSVSSGNTLQNFVLDESYRFLDSRISSSRLNRKMASIANMVDGLFIVSVQEPNMLDGRVRDNYSLEVRCQSFDYETKELCVLVTRKESGRKFLDLTSPVLDLVVRTMSPAPGIFSL